MKLSDELKRRIRQLEEEQNRQESELQDLNALRDLAAISELENELKQIDAKGVAHKVLDEKPKDVDLARETEIMEAGEQAQRELGEPAKPIENIDLSRELLNSKATKPQGVGGYAVCLMFNPTAPSEWSEEAGGGWRGKGLGTHYPSPEQAKAALAKLQQKWPDYPLKIIKIAVPPRAVK
jgi:hypothetical protein